MKTYHFRLVAFDETRYWATLPSDCSQAFGTYLFCEGEATHCCSLTPSSWCEPIENVFAGLDPNDAFVEDNLFTGMDDGIYTPFINPAKRPSWVSRAIEFDAEDREDAWEQAREYFRGNAVSIPIVDRAYAQAAH